MRIVIGGAEELAFRLAEKLMDEHQVALICPESSRSTRLDRLDVDIVYGSPTSTSVLRQASVQEADLFIAASADDENNLIACVGAKHLGADRTIGVLYRLDFLAPPEDRRVLVESLEIDAVIVPAEQLAQEIVRIVEVPGALDVEVFLGGSVHLLQHVIEEGAPITRGTLMEVGVPDGVVLVMGRRDDKRFIPKGNTRFGPGDKVTAMGSQAGIERLLRQFLQSTTHGKEAKRATIVGGGTVGLAVARGLEAHGWTIRIVERDRARCEEIAPLVRGLVLRGDGTDLDLLESERIADDPVLVAVTSNDEKNLLVSLLAKQLGVSRILTRVDQEANERIFEKVGIDVVLSARGAAVQSVLETIGHSKADLLAELEHGDVEVIEIEVPSDLAPTPLRSIKSDIFAIIGAILRAGSVIIPRGEDDVRGGDRLLIFCTQEDEQSVREFFTEHIRDGQE